MSLFSLETRVLALHLGLGDLHRTVCHGFANACPCEECRERDEIVRERAERPAPVRFPWEEAA